MNNSLWIEIIFLDSPFHRVLHLFRLWHRALPARQAQRAFREARETRAAGSRPGSARSDPFHHRLQRSGHRRRKDGELPRTGLSRGETAHRVGDGWQRRRHDERLRTRWEGKATVFFQPERQGKTAAMNRGMKLVDTPIVVFTDANTMVNPQAVPRNRARL